MILPRHVRSGRTPAICCAPPAAARNPEITSSKTSSAPLARRTARAALRESPAAGGTTPMLPAIGSTKTAAICAWDAARTPPRPTPGRCSGPAACRRPRAAGHAGARRHAERHRARSRLHEERIGVAVIAAFELDDAVAPVAARATRSALIAASVPELTKRTAPSTASASRRAAPAASRARSARRSSSRGPPPPPAPSAAPSARGRGSAVPTTSRSRCSVCRRRPRGGRRARARRRAAWPPTALKARTGLSTPPGRIRDAAANSLLRACISRPFIGAA